MQVKKFEAPTMKEALNMIKSQLGPEAIILSAKEIGRGYGIAGRKSVEVTAAVSEITLKKKQLAEKKLSEKSRRRFSEIPASKQKEFIEKVFENTQKENEPRYITKTRYIEIDDEQSAPMPVDASVRIKNATAEAFRAATQVFEEEKPKIKSIASNALLNRNTLSEEAELQKMRSLQSEISYLKKIISEFQKVPQTFVSMHPGAADGVPFELSSTYSKLRKKGLDKEIALSIIKAAQKNLSQEQFKRTSYVDAWSAKFIMDHVEVVDENKCHEKYQAFVGPSGQGKTASLVKLAGHLVICKKKSIAIATCDTQKVGAVEQLKIYARILNVPFVAIRRPDDWEKLDQALPDVDHVLIDYPGLSLKNEMEVQYLKTMLPIQNSKGCAIHYVQSTIAKNSDAIEILKKYSIINPTDIIFTGVDLSNQHGIILNLHKRFQLPLHSFGIGTNIPEDFEMATKERVIDLLFKLTKIQGKRS